MTVFSLKYVGNDKKLFIAEAFFDKKNQSNLYIEPAYFNKIHLKITKIFRIDWDFLELIAITV